MIFLNSYAKQNWRVFFVQNTVSFCKIWILIFKENANFLSESWRKSRKTVINTIDPGQTSFQIRLFAETSR
jgi:hypothetical protein